jgi:Protein of unknown function (DUF448)
VRSPEGTIIIDPTGRAAGRGAYLCRDGACWATAVRRRAVEHALGVSLPEAVATQLMAGPDALGTGPTDQTQPGAPSHQDDVAPTELTDTREGGGHGTE